ncbi:hypothetical protein HanPI659440_Chr10g0396501 [Helianthus annuus]|nr:hypothetical protein HanPI659440_Chr10g0396501 [Helianthus annuus]
MDFKHWTRITTFSGDFSEVAAKSVATIANISCSACGIIDTANDVKVLRELKIIQGDLRDEEIVKLFNGIGRSLGNMSGQSMLRQTVAELNKVYENVPSVRIKKEAEKQARAVAKALTFLVSISGTLVLAREALVQASGSKTTQSIINIVTEHMGHLFRL